MSAIAWEPLIVTSDTTVTMAIARMAGAQKLSDAQRQGGTSKICSSCVFVVEAGQFAGTFTERDVVRLVAQKVSLENLTIGEVITRAGVTLQKSECRDLFSILRLFQQHQLQHLPILNEQQWPVGLITPDSVQRAIASHQFSGHLTLALRSGKIGCWEWDLKQNTVLWDQRMYELYCLPSSADFATLRETYHKRVHPEDRLPLKTLLESAIAGEAEYDTEFRVIHPDGSIHYLKAYGIVVRNAQGEPERMIGVNFDISDRKQAELDLQTKTEELERFFSLALDLFCIADNEGHFFRLNHQWSKILGYPLSQLEGSQLLDYIHPDDLEITRQTMARRNAGESVQGYTNRYRCQDGSYRWLEWTAAPYGSFAYATARDITERIQAEQAIRQQAERERILHEQLQQELLERQQAEANLRAINQQLAQATRLKDEFLANMSHELRTPLTAILGICESLQAGVYGSLSERQRKVLETLEYSGTHLLELINDVLDVAKIEAGQIELDLQLTAIEPLCQSSLTLIKQLASQKNLQLANKIPSSLPDLWVDERRIRQALLNLLNNAVKFTPEGGEITLEVIYPIRSEENLEKPDFLRIAVRDTGIGIASENFSKLFQPFMQLDSALNRQYDGTGLGLALVKRIVELHGGNVGVTSELGVGSCFTLDFPCLSSPALDSTKDCY